jgi:transposase
MRTINLSANEIVRLNYERYHYPCPIVQKRIHAVYLKATLNFSIIAISKIVGLHRTTVSSSIACYMQGGLTALCKVEYGTNKSELEQHKDSILVSFEQKPPRSIEEAVLRIEELTGIKRGVTQVKAFMQRHGLRYIKMGHIPAKADSEKQRQWEQQHLAPAIQSAQEGSSHLLFMDAAHFILMPFICAIWSKIRMFVKASAGRNRINVLGVVHAITKEVTTISNTTYITADTIVDFLKQLKENYYDKPITIVLDNARYQHCILVENIAKELGITLLFLPPYSPNLNIIERLWKFTKKSILYARYYDSPDRFHHAINSFFETINIKHKENLKNLLTLKFQFFDAKNVVFYPA